MTIPLHVLAICTHYLRVTLVTLGWNALCVCFNYLYFISVDLEITTGELAKFKASLLDMVNVTLTAFVEKGQHPKSANTIEDIAIAALTGMHAQLQA